MESVARRAASVACALTFAAILSACAGGQPYKASAIMKPVKHPANGVAEPTDNQARAETPASASASESAPTSASASVLIPPPATIWQSADKLMGLAPLELQAALGKPARIRDEEDGQIYQYIGADCVLDLFLYPADAAAGASAFRVTYAEARSVKAEKKPVDQCLKSLPAPVVADNIPSS